MDGPLVTDIIPTVTREELRSKRRGEEEKKKAEVAKLLDTVSTHYHDGMFLMRHEMCENIW